MSHIKNKGTVDDMEVESFEHVENVEERVERVPVLLKEGDDIANAWYIPLLTTNGNMLFADLPDSVPRIVGIARKSKSGGRIKVGWVDASKEQLRFKVVLYISYPTLNFITFIFNSHQDLSNFVPKEFFSNLVGLPTIYYIAFLVYQIHRSPAEGWGNHVYFCIYEERQRYPNNFFATAKGRASAHRR